MSNITKNGSAVTDNKLDKLADKFEQVIWPEGSTKNTSRAPATF